MLKKMTWNKKLQSPPFNLQIFLGVQVQGGVVILQFHLVGKRWNVGLRTVKLYDHGGNESIGEKVVKDANDFLLSTLLILRTATYHQS